MRTIAALALLWPVSAHATDIKGFTELRGSYALGVDGKAWSLQERIRPEMEVDLGPHVLLGTTVEGNLQEGRSVQDELQRTLSESDFGPILDQAGCAWPTWTNRTLHVDRASDYLSVERLYVDVYQPKFDLRVGRQALQWGSAILVNPTDPLPQVLLLNPGSQRAGVNAARISIPLGTKSNLLQAVVSTDDTFTHGRAAARATVDWLGTDFSLVGAYRGDNDSGLVGVDVKGTLGVGFWLEGAWHLQTNPYEELAVGVDYSFPVLETLVISAQYYRNGGGESDPLHYSLVSRASQGIVPPSCADPSISAALAGPPRDPFAPYFIGTDYALLQVAQKATQDITISAIGLQNLRDGTGIAVPIVTVDPTASIEIAAMAQLPYRAWGRTGEFKPAAPDLIMHEAGPLGTSVDVDLNGMVPDATFSLWTRVSF